MGSRKRGVCTGLRETFDILIAIEWERREFMVILEMFCFVVVCVELWFCFFMLYRNHVTFKNQNIISAAIHDYHLYELHYDREWLVDYEDKEAYDQTLWRLWDFGYTRILPKEKYEIVKEYIKQ